MEAFSLSPSPGFQYAGFWKRFAAYFIDYAILAFAYNTVNRYLDDSMRNSMNDYGEYGYRVSSYMHFVPMLVVFLIQWCYFAGMESSPMQATFGKRAVGIFVTDLEGKRISFGKATGRYFGKIISGLIIGIGYILAGTTDRKQALHDTMAGTLVLTK